MKCILTLLTILGGGTPPAPEIRVTGDTEFTTTLGTQSNGIILTIHNDGNAPLTITAPITAPSGYSLGDDLDGTIIAAGGTQGFYVYLDGTTKGAANGNISIPNDSAVNPYSYAITGYVSNIDIALIEDDLIAVWFGGNGDSPSSLIRDASDETCLDGVRVATWEDLWHGYAPTQATDGSRPTYDLSDPIFNGCGSVVGDGGDSLVAIVDTNDVPFAKDNLTTACIYLVFASTQTTSAGLYSEGNNVSSTPINTVRINRTNPGDGAIVSRSADGTTADGTSADVDWNDGVAHLMTISYDAAATPRWTLRKDGGAVIASDSDDMSAKTYGLNRLALFAFINASGVSLPVAARMPLIVIDAAARKAEQEAIIKTYYAIA